ncbi:MAG: FprA family A-type flavoprotein, partial [Oscillospiraceae bacterium]|nr:FprA family A-type flavoprotein [Oscillospiraceae bacterium]
VMAPMVHWPEVMVTYDKTARILFSADAFGTFGALAGNLFMDETDFERRYLDEARRYYANIVGKYGPSVTALLKKASALELDMICPLHGPVWRKDFEKILDRYARWAAYEPEDRAVMIACASVYGNTQNAADILAARLAERGVRDIVMYDVSVKHPSVIVSEAFRCSHLVFAAPTYNAGVFVTMETVLCDIAAHGLQNRDVAFIENGSWAPTSGKLMPAMLEKLKNIRVIAPPVTVASSVDDACLASLDALAEAIADTL